MSNKIQQVFDFHLKPPYTNKTQQFQQRCGQCFLALQQYKLKTNLLGCNMTQQQLKKYYTYYDNKPKKRLQLSKNKIISLLRAYQRNTIHLQALQLRTVNNMLKNYRRKMNLMANQPTLYNYAKFQKDQIELMETIIANDYNKLQQLDKLLIKIKTADQSASSTLQQKLQTMNKKPCFSKVLKAINRSQVRYYRYFESFQRSIANMVNQIHSYMQRLSQFYTVWENLGSSVIYQMKSDKQVFIDKSLEEKKGRNYFSYEQDEQDILQVIQVMPTGSKMKQIYQQKLQDLKTKSSRCYGTNSSTSHNQANMLTRFRKSNLKTLPQNISKVSWYQTQSQDIKQYTFNDHMILKQKQQGFFKYTYEQLHLQTLSYLDQARNRRIINDFYGHDENYSDRFYIYCQKKQRTREQHSISQRIQKYNVPKQMSFGCWFDRFGPKGVFTVIDFPTNLVQRKIEYQNDRQVQMQGQDQKRKKQYNNKQFQLEVLDDKGASIHIGYKQLNPNKELQDLRTYLTSVFDLESLPKPNDIENLKIQKEIGMVKNRFKEDFSDSQDGQENVIQDKEKDKDKDKDQGNDNQKDKQKINDLNNGGIKGQQYSIQNKDKEQLKQKDNDKKILQDYLQKTNNIEKIDQQKQQQQDSQQKDPQQFKPKKKKNKKQKQSQKFKQILQTHKIKNLNININRNSNTDIPKFSPNQPLAQSPTTHPQQPYKLTTSLKQLKKSYPWFQTKQKQVETLQLFTQYYLTEMQKVIIIKMRNQYINLGHSQDQIQVISYKYLANYQLDSLKQAIFQANYKSMLNGYSNAGNENLSTPNRLKKRKNKTHQNSSPSSSPTTLNSNLPKKSPNSLKPYQKQNLNKIYLVHRQFYIKIEPLFFHQKKKIVKIYIFMISPIKQFQKLKSNLENILSYYGKCTYQLNVDLHERVAQRIQREKNKNKQKQKQRQKQSSQQKFYAMIGHILRNQRLDRSMKNLLDSVENIVDYGELSREGEKVYQNYEAYCRSIRDVEKQFI